MPATIQDLQVSRVADRVQVRFSLPSGDIESIEIYRQCDPRNPKGGIHLLAALGRGQLKVTRDPTHFLYQDRIGSRTMPCRYAVRFLNRQGTRSEFSNFAETVTLVPAAPPRNLSYQVHQERILLAWDPPGENFDRSQPVRIVGYLINGIDFVTGNQYEDHKFQFGQERTYRVQTVSRRDQPPVLSDPVELTLVPKDVFPPARPRNLTALRLQGTTRISWDANGENDLQGYLVYRGLTPGRFQKWSPLIKINHYADEKATASGRYYYRVTAIDKSGNESPPSETVTITLR